MGRAFERIGRFVYSYKNNGHSITILRTRLRIRIIPIGRVSNLRPRSVMKNSALNMAGNSDVSTPIRDNTPIEIKPTTGSPRINEAIVALFSHQGRSEPLQARP